MIQLTRQFRFYLRPAPLPTVSHNNWAGGASNWSFAPFVHLECTVSGILSQPSGYLCDIKQLDDSCRSAINHAAQLTQNEIGPDVPVDHWNPFYWLQVVQDYMRRSIPPHLNLEQLVCRISPYLSFHWRRESSDMVRVTQQFEFSAAHRLHCHNWSAEENRQAFGKCNHPNGHGHNYVVEITLGELSRGGSTPTCALAEIEQVVQQRVITRLDHKHLNLDIPEFSDLNPSVENIASVIWQWLLGQFSCGELLNVRVYETPKTWADCSR